MSCSAFTGIVVDGRFVLDDSATFASLKKSLDGRRIELTLREEPTLPDPARKYYFKTIVERLAKHTGHTVRETHNGLKARFLVKFDDFGREHVRSLTDLNNEERAEYFDRCNAYLGELAVPELDVLPEYQQE